jgi:LDH2 family malate/lactate/ureidoglycolate dehydrogenase
MPIYPESGLKIMNESHQPVIQMDLVPGRKEDGDEDVLTLHEPRCDECRTCTRENRILPAALEAYVAGIFQRHGVPEAEARITAHILVQADVRGIQSHGVARAARYLSGIREGYIVPGVTPEIQEPAPAVGVLDARNGIGQVVADRAMDLALDKASAHGVGVVSVKNSNHYGIAGYYALKAVGRQMVGLSLTNSAPLVVPTFGADVALGTNPIAFGAPARRHPAFLLDMATSVVPRGKLEVYDRNRQQMPAGWTVDAQGYDCENPGHVLRLLTERLGGGILPLGGRGTEFSGHKGYGLSFLVDILAGVLSGAAFGRGVHHLKREVPEGEIAAPNVGHFFMAIDIARFMELDTFTARLDDLMDEVKGSRPALDQGEIYIHGEQSWQRSRDHERLGIPLARNVMCALEEIARECGQPPPRMQPDPTAPDPTAPDPTAPDPTAPDPTAPDPTAPDPTVPSSSTADPAKPDPSEAS